MNKVISIITPCFNEELGILECYETVKNLFEQSLPGYQREHIFCDNASSDRTVELLRSVAVADPCVKVIVNSRNFGILKNTYNGVMNASGDATLLFLPADMQDPPELIPEFVRKWEEGFEIVYGIRAIREEGAILRTLRKVYYRLLCAITYVDYPKDVGDFQLIDKRVLDAMRHIDDAQPFMRLMTFDCGFRSVGIPYTWRARKHGLSKNGLVRMFDQGLNGITSYSKVPLRVALVAGFFLAALSVSYALLLLVFSRQEFSTVTVALFFFGGVQLFFLGVLGEYVTAIYHQVRKKPLVIERERINF